jgi:hypothetical protein
VVRSVGLPSI